MSSEQWYNRPDTLLGLGDPSDLWSQWDPCQEDLYNLFDPFVLVDRLVRWDRYREDPSDPFDPGCPWGLRDPLDRLNRMDLWDQRGQWNRMDPLDL